MIVLLTIPYHYSIPLYSPPSFKEARSFAPFVAGSRMREGEGMRRHAFLCAAVLLFYMLALFIPSQRLESAVGRVKQGHVVLMECTGYCNCWYCTGHHKEDVDYGKTFFGSTARLGTVAADINLFKPGTRLYIPGYGLGVVSDKGSGITGNKLDLWFPDHATARAYGRKQLQVQVLD